MNIYNTILFLYSSAYNLYSSLPLPTTLRVCIYLFKFLHLHCNTIFECGTLEGLDTNVVQLWARLDKLFQKVRFKN